MQLLPNPGSPVGQTRHTRCPCLNTELNGIHLDRQEPADLQDTSEHSALPGLSFGCAFLVPPPRLYAADRDHDLQDCEVQEAEYKGVATGTAAERHRVRRDQAEGTGQDDGIQHAR